MRFPIFAPMKILMVCLGNICRSPLAEGILQHKADEKGLVWTVESAGTSSWHSGEKPDRRSIAKAKEYGIDISGQRSRKFEGYDLEIYDLIYAMDSSNYQDIIRLAKTEAEKAKVKIILNESIPGMNQSVPDPYWNDNGFEEVYQLLEKACSAIVEKYG